MPIVQTETKLIAERYYLWQHLQKQVILFDERLAAALGMSQAWVQKWRWRLGLYTIAGSDFNADAAFDTKAACCFNHKLIPNSVENTRIRSRPKPRRKRLFNRAVYKLRFTSERTFAWIDKFRALLVRFDCKAAHFMGAHYIALINLRHFLADEKVQ